MTTDPLIPNSDSEPMVPLSKALDAVRLAALEGWDSKVWDNDLDDWTDLYERGLVAQASDQSGERWPDITELGRGALGQLLAEVAALSSEVSDG